MIAGDRARFAIEAAVVDTQDGWVFGHVRFWLGGMPVGDWDDLTDLRGCLRWLGDFAEVPRDRVAPDLFALSPTEVFRNVYDPEIAWTGVRSASRWPDAFERFHISHLAMSSFDRFDLLLLRNAEGAERCLWREGSGAISEVLLREGEMAAVAAKFCCEFSNSDKVGSR